jgi:hypothetical protein
MRCQPVFRYNTDTSDNFDTYFVYEEAMHAAAHAPTSVEKLMSAGVRCRRTLHLSPRNMRHGKSDRNTALRASQTFATFLFGRIESAQQ